MLIFLLFVSCYGEYLNKTNIVIYANDKYYDSINGKNKIEINFKSKVFVPFGVTIYTTVGKTLKYKGTSVNYKGELSFFEIINFLPNENHIRIKINHIEDEQRNYIVDIFTFIGLLTIISITLFKKDSKISSVLLCILIILRLYIDFDYPNMGFIIFKKILF